jgi:protein-S-isoprenylcysteine O-methyltransferase
MTAAQLFTLLVLLWVVSEFAIWLFRRSKGGTSSGQFSVSNLVLWGTIGAAVWTAMLAQRRLPFAHIGGSSQSLLYVAFAVFLAGIAIRWWAIIVLGRFFTSDLAVQPGHRIVQAGPYRLIRHPSYSGLLVCFLGSGLAMYNWLSLVLFFVPVLAAIVYRIHVEEAMLEKQFGAEYAEYRRRTRRLAPGIF